MDIKLGLNTYVEEAESILVGDLRQEVVLSKNSYDKMTLFTMSTHMMAKDEFYNYVSDLILKIIIENHLLNNIKKSIFIDNKHVVGDEKSELYEIARNKVLDENNYILDREYIREELIQYMEEYPIIYLDGFIVFRLKNLMDFTDMIIEQSMESLNQEKEHEDFMEVLKYLADSGNIGYDTVRIIFEKEGYKILDEDGLDIDKEYFRNIANTINEPNISDEDLLISTLIALSPEKILIHIGDYNDEEITSVIERIFENKVYYCYNCKNCIRKVGIKTR